MKHTYFDIENWATANLMYFGSRDNVQTWCLSGIEVHRKFRHRGVASRLLKQVTEAADAEGTVLVLSIQPDGSRGSLWYDDLEKWYTRSGFIMDEDLEIMTRQPQSKATTNGEGCTTASSS